MKEYSYTISSLDIHILLFNFLSIDAIKIFPPGGGLIITSLEREFKSNIGMSHELIVYEYSFMVKIMFKVFNSLSDRKLKSKIGMSHELIV